MWSRRRGNCAQKGSPWRPSSGLLHTRPITSNTPGALSASIYALTILHATSQRIGGLGKIVLHKWTWWSTWSDQNRSPRLFHHAHLLVCPRGGYLWKEWTNRGHPPGCVSAAAHSWGLGLKLRGKGESQRGPWVFLCFPPAQWGPPSHVPARMGRNLSTLTSFSQVSCQQW